LNRTCNNWTSSTFGSTMLGHGDRRGGLDAKPQHCPAQMSRSCSQEDLIKTGGNGLLYRFTVQ
jgi:hypothetical protein